MTNPGQPVVAPVTFGTAELRPDPNRPDAWTLLVDGVPQSYVDLSDPRRLDLEYLRRLSTVIDAAAPAGLSRSVLHLGGGALSLVRYVAVTRPGSPQHVVDRDGALMALVQQRLPLPVGTDIAVHECDVGAAVGNLPSGTFDLIIVDVYQAAQLPAEVLGGRFARQAARLLGPRGIYAINVADLPPLATTRVQAATLRATFGELCLIGDRSLLRGRRYGNVVLVAAAEAGRLPIEALTVAARRDPVPGRVLTGPALDAFIAGAQPS